MADKIIEAQKNVRLKAMQAQEFFKDLETWEESVAKKDKQLQKASAVKKNLPPVRSQQAGETPPAQQAVKTTAPQSSTAAAAAIPAKPKESRIKSGDYRAWDRFDVDAELAMLEAEEKRAAAAATRVQQGNADALEDAAPMDDSSLRDHMAAIEKDNGNDQFKAGKYAAAVECYTRGLESCPDHAILLANRAMALLKLKKYGDARDDAARAISLDAKYVKAYSRRATACSALGEFDQAIRDWESIVRLEPKNKAARAEIKALKKRKEEAEAEKHRSFNPLKAAESLARQKRATEKPLVRIPIQEVGEPRCDEQDEDTTQEKSAAKVVPAAVSSAATSPSSHSLTQSATRQTKAVLISEMEGAPSAPSASPSSSTDTEVQTANSTPAVASDHASSASAEPHSEAFVGGKKKTGTAATQGNDRAPSTAAAAAAPVASGRTRQAAAIPQGTSPQRRTKNAGALVPDASGVTPYVFETTWQRLLDSPVELARFLEGLEPKRFPEYMSHIFDAAILTKVLTLLKDYFIADGVRVAPVMRQLMKVPRFDVAVMFLDDEEKQPARELIAALEKGATPDPQVKEQTIALFKQAYDV